jgi:phospholipid-binding lipoprotein MlaA
MNYGLPLRRDLTPRKRASNKPLKLTSDRTVARFALLVLLGGVVALCGATAEADSCLAEMSVRPPHAAADPLFDDLEAESEAMVDFPDPLENVNRRTLRFNDVVDRWLLDPITNTYGFLVPGPVKRSVRRFFINLNSPAVMVNDMLQREWTDAGTTAGRLVLNSTIGVAGIFDPATRLGMEGHESDFGQTLALAGVGSGPYLMLPVLGPTTTRDGLGGLVDMMLRPTTLLLTPGTQLLLNTIEGGTSGLVTREANTQALRALRSSSVDYYAALKNAYYQDRIARIWTGREHHRPIPAEEQMVVADAPQRREPRSLTGRRFLPPGRQSSGSH